MNIDEIFDVGRQRDYHERGLAVPPEARCLLCSRTATMGSWCAACHPSVESPDRCVRCGRPLVDGVERITRVCHTCRVMGEGYGYD